MWVKFLQDWTQKGVEGNDPTNFKKDQVVELDDEISKSLIKLDYVEETNAPEHDIDLEGLTKSLTGVVEKTIESSLKKTIDGLSEKLEKGVPFIHVNNADDKELRGFQNEGQFLKCVYETAAAVKDGRRPNSDIVGGEQYFDYLEKAPSGQNVSNDVEGGFLVPDVMQNRIWDNMEENPASFLPKTDRYETVGNSTKIRKMNEVSRKVGSGMLHAGIQVTWLDEADQIQATKGTVGKDTLELHKLGAVVYFTEEQLEDAPMTWNNRIKRLVPEAIMFEVNYQFLHGTGVGKPKGLLKEDSLIVIPTGARNGAAQSNHTLLHWNLSQMYWRNWNRAGAMWLCHPDTAQQMEFVYFDDDTTNKRPVYSPVNRGLVTSGAELFVGPYGQSMLVHEMCQDFATKGDIFNVDWSQYASLTKVGGGVKTASSIHVRFLFEETAFRFTFRVGGKSLWTTPKEDLHGDTTRSPVTTLASRTGGSTSTGL